MVSPSHHVQNHPLAAVGLASAAGFAAVMLSDSWRPAARQVVKAFEPELKLAKSMGITLLTQLASDKLKASYPEVANALTEFDVKLKKGE